MKQEIVEKVQAYLKDVAIYKDSATTNSLFSGRNLPSFVKDFLLRRFSRGEEVDAGGLSRFLSEMMPKGNIKRMLHEGQEVKLLTRFTVNIDLRNNICRFGIPEQGIGENEGLIPFCVGGQFVSFKNSSREGIPQINGGKWGFMDEDGKEVIPAQYDYVTAFNEGMAQVTKNGVTSVLHNPLKQKPAGGKLGKEVDGNVPETSKSDENLFAFVIANENYAHLKGADYAINDGKVFVEYCKKTLGVPERNVRYYEDATYGNIVGAMNKMKEIAEVYEGDAKIIFYFAGLGATDTQSKERYLIPADGSLETLKSTGYSVASLQKALNDMNTTYTLAVIDAPFSNVDRNGKMLAAARGVRIVPKRIAPQGKTVICTSSMNDETAYASKDYGHGLFTFALLQQLQQTKGNGSLKELIDNASKWTRKEALKLFDQRQTPQQTVSTEMEQKWQNIKFE